jgi:Protein of unknown function DUF262/Protein of unknown function (DUF1524)
VTDNKDLQIGFEQIGLGAVLKRYRLAVPLNQREYSWTDKEVKKLLTDFARAISDEGQEYFLGTLVTIPRSAETLEVVDGQQRLATTAILLSEIRNYLKDKDPIISEDIDNNFLSVIDRDKRERVPKLELNVDDNSFFRALLKPEPSPPSPKAGTSHELLQGAFVNARLQVQSIVLAHDVKDHGNILNKWIDFIEHDALVILLKVPTTKNAYRMFETLNDRGLKTSQADLVKNHLFGQAGNRLNEAQQKWTLMKGSLESLEEDDIVVTFLRQSLIVIRGYLTAADVYDAVQEKAKGPQTSIELLTNFERLASTYVAILNSESDKWNAYPDSMRRAVQTLDRLNLRVLRPIMLAVAERFSQNEATLAFQNFIALSVRLLVASSTRSESIIEPIATAAHEVFKGDIQTWKDLKSRLLKIIPTDDQFKQAFETATVSKAALARYFLRSLEMAAKQEATPWFVPNDDRQTINLEHVLPEKPESNWPNFDEEQVRGYSKRIGNLALLLAKSNSDLKSAGFEVKKEIYQNTPYVLTSQIATLDTWGETEIAERQKVLAGFALVAWPI